jgi:hypothetical protein
VYIDLRSVMGSGSPYLKSRRPSTWHHGEVILLRQFLLESKEFEYPRSSLRAWADSCSDALESDDSDDRELEGLRERLDGEASIWVVCLAE